MLEPGVDHSKAIGTEMRFFSIYHPLASSPKMFRYALEHERYDKGLIRGCRMLIVDFCKGVFFSSLE